MMQKEVINKSGVFPYVQMEKEILKSCDSEFVPKLVATFETQNNYYLIQQYISGGDFFYHLSHERFSHSSLLSNLDFYAGQICLALKYLHQMPILYRNLKPENLMICEKGNIKLVDFSISKRLPTKSAMTTTFCGTAEYMAPEIIFGTRYGIEVDWWSLGILLYELSVKQLPFTGSISDIQNSIMTQPPVFPSSIEPTLQRFISE